MGAPLVNVFNSNLNAVDVRPLIGQNAEIAVGILTRDKKFTEAQVDVQDVSDDPSWDANATATASQFAPAAVSAGQPLTLYVQNGVVAGIEVTSPTRALQLRVEKLEKQLNNMGQTGLAADAATPSNPTPSSPGK
jgi:hypothetical protein